MSPFLSLSGRDLGPHRQVYLLQLEVRGQAFGAELAADAGRLVAAERRAELHREAVDGVRAGAHAPGDIQPVPRIGTPHRARQPVIGIVGDADRIALVLVRDQRQHGAEDLFAGDAHAVVDVDEQRRLDVPALPLTVRTSAATGDLRALLLAGADVALDAIALPRGDQRAAERGGIHGVTDRPIAD